MDSRFKKEITTEMKGKRRASQMYEQHINRKKKEIATELQKDSLSVS